MDINIYLDMDVVCTQFIEAAVELHGKNMAEVTAKWTTEYLGEFHIDKVLDMSKDAFWGNIENAGEKFWVNLKETIWFRELYKQLEVLGTVIFLTAPTYSSSCLSGKLIWLQNRFGKNFDKYVITGKKHLLANAHSVLIDDHDNQIKAFEENGGCGILFPTIYNLNNNKVENRIEYTISKIKEFKG